MTVSTDVDTSHYHSTEIFRLIEQSQKLLREKNLEEAEFVCRQALKCADENLGRDYCMHGHALDHLSIILTEQHKYVAARLACEEALEILNRDLGHDAPVVQNLIGRLHHLSR